MRGGYSGALGRRHVIVNDNLQLLYLDANSLYARAMSQPLPTGDVQWENPDYFWTITMPTTAIPTKKEEDMSSKWISYTHQKAEPEHGSSH